MFFVLSQMAWLFPKLSVVDNWRDDFLVTSVFLLFFYHFDETVENFGSPRQEKSWAWWKLVPHKQMILLPKIPVISFLQFLHMVNIVLSFFFVFETYSVNSVEFAEWVLYNGGILNLKKFNWLGGR